MIRTSVIASSLFVIILLTIGIGTGGYFFESHRDNKVKGSFVNEALAVYRSGPFQIGVQIIPETPIVGDNKLLLRVRDSSGTLISSMKFEVFGQMPAMGSMSTMRAPADLKEISAGVYEGNINLPMSGAWPLTIQMQKTGTGRARLSFDMATGRQGLQLASGGIAVSSAKPTDKPATQVVDGLFHATGPGQCSDCDMALGPGMSQDIPAGTFTIDNRRRQLIGLKTTTVTKQNVLKTIRAVAKVDYDESRLADVTLRFDSWIGKLNANYVGKTVTQGEVLFTVYSPELLATQQEYLEVFTASQGQPGRFIAAARKRLLLWGMIPRQIKQLEQRGEPLDYVPIVASRSGTIVKKNIVIGSANKAGMTLMRIADLSRVWIEADVYESDLEFVSPGMEALVTLPYLPGQTFNARVDYIYPYLMGTTRTGRIRLGLDNPDGVLKPDMYAEVKLRADLGQRLVVPEEAVLFAGDSRVVFVDLGGGKLRPQKILTGIQEQNYIEVLEGLHAGEQVVTSGNFLIAAESRLKSGIEQW